MENLCRKVSVDFFDTFLNSEFCTGPARHFMPTSTKDSSELSHIILLILGSERHSPLCSNIFNEYYKISPKRTKIMIYEFIPQRIRTNIKLFKKFWSNICYGSRTMRYRFEIRQNLSIESNIIFWGTLIEITYESWMIRSFFEHICCKTETVRTRIQISKTFRIKIETEEECGCYGRSDSVQVNFSNKCCDHHSR